MTTKKAFYLYQSQDEVVNQLTDEQAGQLFKAIYAYNSGKEYKLDPTMTLVFIPIRQQLDRCKENYEKVSKINSENAKKRWSQPQEDAKTSEPMRSHANGYGKDKDKDKDKLASNFQTSETQTDSVKDIFVDRLFEKRSSTKSISNPESYKKMLGEDKPIFVELHDLLCEKERLSSFPVLQQGDGNWELNQRIDRQLDVLEKKYPDHYEITKNIVKEGL